MKKNIVIAIDGPAGSGKSSTARALAERLGIVYVDTGAMYRAVTLAALRANIPFREEELTALLHDIQITLQPSANGQRTLLNNEDVSESIRSREVTAAVSEISSFASVRNAMTLLQRSMGASGGIVMDGRDIGTNVFPNADLKIFMVASARIRAERRHKELVAKGVEISLDELEQEIIQRDNADSSRALSPLRKAPDAVEIDTTALSPDEQLQQIISMIQQR